MTKMIRQMPFVVSPSAPLSDCVESLDEQSIIGQDPDPSGSNHERPFDRPVLS